MKLLPGNLIAELNVRRHLTATTAQWSITEPLRNVRAWTFVPAHMHGMPGVHGTNLTIAERPKYINARIGHLWCVAEGIGRTIQPEAHLLEGLVLPAILCELQQSLRRWHCVFDVAAPLTRDVDVRAVNISPWE